MCACAGQTEERRISGKDNLTMSIVVVKDLLSSPVPPPQTICGRDMTADINWYPRSEYRGRSIYFCTEFCLEAFKADPDRFHAAHRKKKDNRQPA